MENLFMKLELILAMLKQKSYINTEFNYEWSIFTDIFIYIDRKDFDQMHMCARSQKLNDTFKNDIKDESLNEKSCILCIIHMIKNTCS